MKPFKSSHQNAGRLPGLGQPFRAAHCAAPVIEAADVMLPLAAALREAAEEVRECAVCGNLDTRDPCGVCSDTKRDRSKICVVAQVSDLWAVERTGAFKGLYHVLGGLLSAIDGIGPEDLRIRQLIQRTQDESVKK